MTTVTAIDVDELVRMHSADECPIEKRTNRYLMVPPGETKAVPLTRATTLAKTLDDGFGINAWARRLTAVGFAQNPVLFAKLCSTDPDDKAALDGLCDEAKTKAGGDDARDLGTALHAFTEKEDKGQPIYIPEPWAADVAAYRATLADLGIEILPDYVERYVYVPDLDGIGVGGKEDRIVGFGSRLLQSDLKTGTLGDYSWLPIAMQLAIYSRAASFYNPRTKSHEPFPAVDQDVGLVFHVPAGQARCAVWFVDLNLGWEAAQTAAKVRAWRRRRDIAEELRPDAPSRDVGVRRARLIERIAALRAVPGGVEGLAAIWPAGVATFKASDSHSGDELDLIALAISTVETRVQAPFGPLDPADSISSQTKEQP